MLHVDSRRWGRPPEVWTLVAFNVLGAVVCILGVSRPVVPGAPTGLFAFMAVVGSLLGLALWVAGARTPVWARHANVVAIIACTSLLVARSATSEGAVATGFAYVGIGLYVALFLPRHQARCYLALVSLGSLVGLHANDHVTIATRTWIPVVLAVVVSAEILAGLVTQIRALTLTDPLTGVLNRTGFHEAVDRERLAAGRTGEPLALVVIDLDGFKQVNDRHGHAAGDTVLGEVTGQWRSALRPRDLVARRGGDEFSLLLPNTSEGAAEALASRLRDASTWPWSYGVTLVAPDDAIDDALHRADERMYRQKAGA